ncbi:hypothetical protein GGI20_001334 [Coemansia sp. BCRC 34301]|nr:hypothetical protein GGI20_001334 [Coemansia sp. BCRC 34301]
MSFSSPHSVALVHGTNYLFQPQASTSPATSAYPPYATTEGVAFFGHYPPVSSNFQHYPQQQHILASATTAATPGAFHPGPAARSSAEDREEKRRKEHSITERNRRQRMNSSIDDLRMLIPDLGDTQRLQKVDIMEHAVRYIKELKAKISHAHSALPAGGKKRKRKESQTLFLDSGAAANDENSDNHMGDNYGDKRGHRASPSQSLCFPTRHGNRRHRSSSETSRRLRQQNPMQQHAVVTYTHADAFSLPHFQPAGSAGFAEEYAAAATAAAAAIDVVVSASPLPVASSASASRTYTLANVPDGYWDAALSSRDTPSLMSPGSSTASKASSTHSVF